MVSSYCIEKKLHEFLTSYTNALVKAGSRPSDKRQQSFLQLILKLSATGQWNIYLKVSAMPSLSLKLMLEWAHLAAYTASAATASALAEVYFDVEDGCSLI